MRGRTALLALLSLFCERVLRAQNPFSLIPGFGVEAGVPLNQMFSTYSITTSGYPVTYTPFSFAVPRYQVGAYAHFHFTRHWGFEVDGLFRRETLPSSSPYISSMSTRHLIPGNSRLRSGTPSSEDRCALS